MQVGNRNLSELLASGNRAKALTKQEEPNVFWAALKMKFTLYKIAAFDVLK